MKEEPHFVYEKYVPLIEALEGCSNEQQLQNLLQNPAYSWIDAFDLVIALLTCAVGSSNPIEAENSEDNVEAEKYTNLTLAVAKILSVEVPYELPSLNKQQYQGYSSTLKSVADNIQENLGSYLDKLDHKPLINNVSYVNEFYSEINYAEHKAVNNEFQTIPNKINLNDFGQPRSAIKERYRNYSQAFEQPEYYSPNQTIFQSLDSVSLQKVEFSHATEDNTAFLITYYITLATASTLGMAIFGIYVVFSISYYFLKRVNSISK